MVSQKNIYTNNWKNIPCIQESLHSSGGFLFSYQQTSGKMFLHSLALSCPLMSFLTPIQVRTGQIIICRSIGYVEVICTEVYMKGSAIIELFELWEHIVCMCMCVMCVWLYTCVHVFKVRETEQVTYTRCIKQMFPLYQGKKTRTSAKTFGFFHYFSSLYHNILCSFICVQNTWTIDTPIVVTTVQFPTD